MRLTAFLLLIDWFHAPMQMSYQKSGAKIKVNLLDQKNTCRRDSSLKLDQIGHINEPDKLEFVRLVWQSRFFRRRMAYTFFGDMRFLVKTMRHSASLHSPLRQQHNDYVVYFLFKRSYCVKICIQYTNDNVEQSWSIDPEITTISKVVPFCVEQAQ